MTKITVNGKEHVVTTKVIGYEEVCKLAGLAPEYRPTMVWHSRTGNRQGSLLPGKACDISPFMVFNVAHTGSA